MTKEELEIAKAAYCVGKIWNIYEGKENFDHMVELRVKHLIKLVRNYQQLSLPSNLDEATEKIASDIAPMYPDISWDSCFEKIKEGIKAGAEWMAGQGVSMLGRVGIYGVDVESITKELREAGFNLGEEIILQIRKKQ